MWSRLLFLVTCLVFSGFSVASDFVVTRDVFIDSSNRLEISSVVKQKFQPSKRLLADGYSAATYWLRIVVAPTDKKYLEMRIRPTYLDEVVLYQQNPDKNGVWHSQYVGDVHAFDANIHTRGSGSLGFMIKGRSEPTVYYLRMKTTSTSLLFVEVLDPQEAASKDIWHSALMVIYLALMLWLTIWAMNEFFTSQYRLIGLFLVYQFTHTIYALSVMGYLGWFFQPPLADKITSVLVLSALFTGVIFHYAVLLNYKPSRIGMNALLFSAALFPVLLCLLFLGYSLIALKINAYIILFCGILFFVLPFTTSQEGVPSRKILIIIYSLQSLMIAVSIIPFVGLMEAREWVLNISVFYSFTSGFLMYSMLQTRAVAIRREAENARLALHFVEQELSFERKKRDEQGFFMAMISHELKTPLSVIRLALDTMNIAGPFKRHVDRSIQDIGNMVDRCALISQLEDQSIHANYERCNVKAILLALLAESEMEKKVVLHVASEAWLATDIFMLRHILRNLLDNACKYSVVDELISVEIQPATMNAKCGFMIDVENVVDAIPDISCIFDKYYRGAKSSRTTGFGLGLYLSRVLTDLLHGSLTVTLQDNKIRFSLWLPA